MKKIILVLITVCSLLACGCSSNTAKTIENISKTVSRVESVIKKIDIIPEKTLFISEIMDTNNLRHYEKNNVADFEFTSLSNNNINNHINNLYSLSSIAQNTININNTTEYYKTCLTSKCSNLKNLCKLISKKECNLTNDQTVAITDLCSNVIANTNKLYNTKNDTKPEIKEISILKNNFSKNIEKLNSNFTKLTNDLEIRNSYLSSINFGIDNIYDLLLSSSYSTINNQTNTWSNINTYSNANNKSNNQLTNNNPNINYGHGGTNPYYYYGNNYGMMGGRYNGFGRYPYSPYSNYNPYMPNVDTFGTYTNVDTYKPTSTYVCNCPECEQHKQVNTQDIEYNNNTELQNNQNPPNENTENDIQPITNKNEDLTKNNKITKIKRFA